MAIHASLRVCILAFLASTTVSQRTNLPDVPPGLFEVGTRLEIRSTIPATWHALTNFPNYADWNPFVRTAIVTNPFNETLPEQYPVEGKDLFMRTQIPPLPLPVNRYTLDNPLATNLAYEEITHIQKDLGRLAWRYKDETLLQAERWQAISQVRKGVILYESREVFSGALAQTLKDTMEENLQLGFEAQGKGLKLLLEKRPGPYRKLLRGII